jgi:stage V sporulation protein S
MADGFTNSLRVKADRNDITPEERRRRVRKLAGAVAHALRHNGEVSVRCFGNPSIGKAAKAIAISSGFLASHDLALYCAPAFIDAEMDGISKTGLSFFTFAEDMQDGFPEIEGGKELRVKSDSDDVSDDERKKSVKSLAGAISHCLRDDGRVKVRCFGNMSIGKAVKAMAVARGFVAVHGMDLYCTISFIEAKMDDDEMKTGLSFYVFVGGNESE